jgi:hypothetical protein
LFFAFPTTPPAQRSGAQIDHSNVYRRALQAMRARLA